MNAAINVLNRHGDPDITIHTPHCVVKRIVQERADRHRIRLPIPDSSCTQHGVSTESEPSTSTLNNEQ